MSIVWQTEIKNYKRQRTKTIDSAALDDHVTQRFQKNFAHQSKLANNLIWFRVKEYKLKFILVARYRLLQLKIKFLEGFKCLWSR